MAAVTTGSEAVATKRRVSPRRLREKPKSDRRPLASFTYGVALPAVLVYVAVFALVLTSLWLMTADLNRIDSERDRRAVMAATRSFLSQLEQIVADEATDTEAYLNTYVNHNPAWLDGSWGSSARSGANFDTVIVTDATGRIVFGENQRGALRGDIGQHFSAPAKLLEALDAAIGTIGDGASVARFSKSSDGVTALAAAVVRSSAAQASIPHEERRILWLSRRLDEVVLKEIGKQFQIPKLRLAGTIAAEEDHLLISDAGGADIGQLAWRPVRPGDPALMRAATIASLVMLVIGVLTFAVLAAFRLSIKRRAEADERDWYKTRYDAGTGLMNGFRLQETLARLIPKRRDDVEVAVAHIEFEGLRDVTDAYGPETTERLLELVADLIDEEIDGGAMLARVGPDAFLLCRVGDEAGNSIRQFARIISEILGEPVSVGDLRLKIGCSIGIAATRCSNETLAEPIRMAAAALQQARETGGGQMIEYDPAIDERRQHRLDLQADIRRGLEAEEFEVVYQPLFDVTQQEMGGVEALVRWRRRDGSHMSPSEFIPAAEASGLIEELGMFVLRRACREMAQFPKLKLSVNVSTVQFRNPRLARQIDRILLANNFPAERLQLEITESFLLAQPARAKAAIEELRDRGISIALDDFGTGFASIGYLQAFQFDRVKIDRSLVSDIDRDAVKAALIDSTIVFAYAMGLAVTAEGVERHEEARALVRLGCREFQGYLFSQPLSLEGLERLISSGGRMRLAS